MFALPLVLVAGIAATRGEATLPGVLDDVGALAALLRGHGALAGNQSIALANVLVGADALDLPRLPELMAWQRLPDASSTALPARVVVPRPLSFAAGAESVHLRFLLGTALARPGAALFAARATDPWGMPLAQALARQLPASADRLDPGPAAAAAASAGRRRGWARRAARGLGPALRQQRDPQVPRLGG